MKLYSALTTSKLFFFTACILDHFTALPRTCIHLLAYIMMFTNVAYTLCLHKDIPEVTAVLVKVSFQTVVLS